MSIVDDLLDLMTDKVTVEAFLMRDSYGQAAYGSPMTYAARVNYSNHYVRTAEGEQVVARGYAIINRTDPISTMDRITLADGSTPLILVSNAETDETGPIYVRIDFA